MVYTGSICSLIAEAGLFVFPAALRFEQLNALQIVFQHSVESLVPFSCVRNLTEKRNSK